MPRIATRKSAYQSALAVATWCALMGVTMSCAAMLWPPHWNGLVALQRLEIYKQLTGYILVFLLGFDLLFAVIKRLLIGAKSQRPLQLMHRTFGLAMLGMLVLHAGFSHQGFLHATFVVTMVVVVAGALMNVFPSHKVASWGQLTTVLHIGAGCLLSALALMHLYFVYNFAS